MKTMVAIEKDEEATAEYLRSLSTQARVWCFTPSWISWPLNLWDWYWSVFDGKDPQTIQVTREQLDGTKWLCRVLLDGTELHEYEYVDCLGVA